MKASTACDADMNILQLPAELALEASLTHGANHEKDMGMSELSKEAQAGPTCIMWTPLYA